MATLKKAKAIRGAVSLARQIGQFPATRLWLDYDAGADVLYISLKRPQKATETVEDVYEPFLLQLGLLMRTPRGRVATAAAWRHLGLEAPPGDGIAGLFD